MNSSRLALTFLILITSFCIKAGDVGKVELVVLGVAQDAGYPQLNCYKPHCMPGWEDFKKRKLATSLALIDQAKKQKYLFEATPDIKEQLYRLNKLYSDSSYSLAGVFLTHAHMGHYAGLMHFGREAAGTKNLPVYAMPKMKKFLSTNGPWEQLVKLKNIKLEPINNLSEKRLSKNLSVTPIIVPHRDEYSETVGFIIQGPKKKVLFVPDIDKWQKWDRAITDMVKSVDYALIDATFFANGELPNRDMSEVPHPFVEESMALMKDLTKAEKAKVIFIHFNHTNPLIQKGSSAQKQVTAAGFNYAEEGMRFEI